MLPADGSSIPKQIRVNNVNPGFIETDQTMHMDATLRENQCKEVPLGRFSKPYEQAGQVVYLLSKYSSYQTGSSIYIDGVRPVPPFLLAGPCPTGRLTSPLTLAITLSSRTHSHRATSAGKRRPLINIDCA